jgi:GH24 family phage-related lysozyme (muramidase)
MITFGEVKSRCAKVLNLNSTDARVLDYVNRATERLLYEGGWKDTFVRYAVCVTGGCLTWPREIETIESIALCGVPITIRNQWYEFLENGPGVSGPDCGPCLTMIDRGTSCVFQQPLGGSNKVLAIYADGTEDVGEVVLKFYDSNGNKVYRDSNGVTTEGETVGIPAAGTYAYAVNTVLGNGVYGVVKPETNHPIRLYEFDNVAGTYLALGYYEPSETVPEYRQSWIPSANSGTTGEGCNSQQVNLVAKRRFIPAVDDNSILVIGHGEAIRLACQAIKKEEDNTAQEAAIYWGLALNCLNSQLRHYRGSGTVAPLRIIGSRAYGGGFPNIV